MTDTINLSDVGQPAPNGWQVMQVQIGGKMFVKLIIASPTGIDVHFLDGEAGQQLASNLKRASRAALAGIWTPGGPEPVRHSGAEEPSGGEQAADPISPSTGQSGGQ